MSRSPLALLVEAAIITRIGVSRPEAGDGVARAVELQSGPRTSTGRGPRKAREVEDMAVRIGDEAPDFTAETTEGKIRFHEWIGDKWAILFSHPKDFTPVCTTELGYMAGLSPESESRTPTNIGPAIDPVTTHQAGPKHVQRPQGTP